MRRYLALMMVAGLALTLASPCEAGAGHSTLKPNKPPSGGGSQAGGGQSANLDTHAHQVEADLANRLKGMAGRELDGTFKTSSDRGDKLPAFDGDWIRDGIGQKLITLETSSPVAALRIQIVADLLARGISVRPTPTQLAALQTFVANPTQNNMNRQLFEYFGDIAANRGFRNTEIEIRAPQSIYERVDASQMIDPYESFVTLLQHNGAIGNDHANRYTPARSPLHR